MDPEYKVATKNAQIQGKHAEQSSNTYQTKEMIIKTKMEYRNLLCLNRT